jgi:hypothetical protein
MADKDTTYRFHFDTGRRGAADTVKDIRRDADGLEKDLKQAARAADGLDRSLESASRGADFGRTGGGLERILGGAIGGGSQELLGIVGDLGDVIEGLGEGGLKGALKGLISPAGLLSGGLAVAGVAMAALTSEIERQKKAAQDYVAYVVGSAQSEEALLQQLRDNGTEAIEAVRKTQSDQFSLISAGAQASQTIIDNLKPRVEEARRTGVYFNGFTQAVNELQAAEEALAASREETLKLVPAVEALNNVRNSEAFAAAKAAESFETLTKFLDTGRSAVDDIANVVTGALDSIGDMAQETADAAEEALNKTRDTAQAAVDKLDADGTKLSDSLRATLAALNDDLLAAQTDAAADIVAAQQDAAAARLEAEREYQSELNRAEVSFRREQASIRRAALLDERSAIEENNIIALLEVRDGKREQLRENRQNYKDEQAQRAEDFAARRAAEDAALADTIASIERQRDAEIAGINARITEEQKAFDAAIAEVNRLKLAQIAQVEAVIAANERKHAAELAAVETVKQGWEALVLYQNGQLYQLNPALKNSPPTAGSLLAVPPPPVDPFGLGQFFNSPPPTEGTNAVPEGRQSAPPPTIVFSEGSIVVGDIASKEDVKAAIIEGVIKPMAQARGVAA